MPLFNLSHTAQITANTNASRSDLTVPAELSGVTHVISSAPRVLESRTSRMLCSVFCTLASRVDAYHQAHAGYV